MTRFDRFIDTFFKPEVMQQYWPDIVSGLFVTCQIAILVIVSGISLGLALAILRSYGFKVINLPIVIFVDLLRALPPLVLILILYFGLPNLGINLSGFLVLWMVLTLVLAAFAEEIFWAGILSVPEGQWQAARSTGLGRFQTLIYVVIPQAVRMTVAP